MTLRDNRVGWQMTMKQQNAPSKYDHKTWRIIVASALGCLLFVSVLVLVVLPAIEQYLTNAKKEMIYELTAASWELVKGYQAQVDAGELSKTQAQERALARLQQMRYGPEAKDYFWVNDTNYVMLMHPYRPDLVGQQLKDYLDKDGKPLFRAFVDTARQRGQGYVSYKWQWKDNPSEIVPKMSHVRLFEPWGWVIGTGIYVEDVRTTIAALKTKLVLAAGVILLALASVSVYMVFRTREAERGKREADKAMHRLDMIVETTSDMVSIATPEGDLTYLNEAGYKMMGLSSNVDCQTLKISDMHPDTILNFLQKEAIPHAISEGVWSGESAVRKADGTVVPVSQVIIAHFDSRNELEFLSTVIRDITTSRKMEQELKRSRDELERRVAERTRSLADTNERLQMEVTERKTAEQSLRYRADFEKLINTVSAEFISCPLEEIDTRLSHALSEVGWFLRADRSYVVVYDHDREHVKNVYGWASGGIAELQEHFAALNVESWDWYNQMLQDVGLFKYLHGMAMPDECTQQQDVLQQDNVQSMISIPLKWEQGIFGFFGMQVISRQTEWAEDLVVLFKVLGEILGHAIQRQYTENEKLRLEAQLRQAQKMESIGQLAAGIAHEINTPTQFVGDNIRFMSESFRDVMQLVQELKMCLGEGTVGIPPNKVRRLQELLEEADWEYVEEEVPRAVEQTLDGVSRIAKIVQAMKEFSHPGGEGKQSVNINRVIESTLIVAHTEWKYIANIEENYGADLPLVTCLRDEISQVILNILINACHAIAENHVEGRSELGHVVVRTYLDGAHVAVDVSDDGPGIPPEVGKRIFDPFYTTKEVGKGTGQGLYIAYDIVVNKHGGTLSFDSEIGKGTTFSIRLPI